MTPQEQSMLGDLIRRVQQTQLQERDPEAQQLLEQQLAGNPDSLYVLAQTVLVQKYALEQAQRQMEQLRRQPPAPVAKPTSFLGGLFGHSQQEAPPAAQQQGYPPQQPTYTPVNQPAYAYPAPGSGYGAPPAYPPAYPGAYQGSPGGGSSFLRSAATTAAGVAAGALAFEGVESLMHGFGHQAGFGGGGFGGGMPMEENVVNNYYDEPRGGNESRFGTSQEPGSNQGDQNQQGLESDRYGDAQNNDLEPQLDQADDVNVTDDSGSYDDASLGDDSGGSDDSSFV